MLRAAPTWSDLSWYASQGVGTQQSLLCLHGPLACEEGCGALVAVAVMRLLSSVEWC